MARLCEGEYEERQKQIFRLLQLYRWGVKESEIAQELGLDRRTVNNYLGVFHFS
jgi:DNA-binding NarL/FixJ family response regulator